MIRGVASKVSLKRGVTSRVSLIRGITDRGVAGRDVARRMLLIGVRSVVRAFAKPRIVALHHDEVVHRSEVFHHSEGMHRSEKFIAVQ